MKVPSSETFLHGLIYKENDSIQAVIHAHDEVATSINLNGILDETEREEPYGTVELALLALNTFKKGNNIFILKNHGYVAVGHSLTKVTNSIIAIHNKLMQIKSRQK
jgi:ribulose-5-phosphate 4-epimerase/fuculose-1-phosphate aldolase